jgi:hypothetical protein
MTVYEQFSLLLLFSLVTVSILVAVVLCKKQKRPASAWK